jgi:hypothetical protein
VLGDLFQNLLWKLVQGEMVVGDRPLLADVRLQLLVPVRV